ncbi:hypothetical protein GGX14DRAFT_701376 [Mycena pura]|uniref:Uncharacterized protein n=1 Tax=Mycena pura TaxID=153505 RepID=A0AAD6XYC9_9AGAR|nr:hypothetical protein GGX14DRAFT_701376 [Mycena pura]
MPYTGTDVRYTAHRQPALHRCITTSPWIRDARRATSCAPARTAPLAHHHDYTRSAPTARVTTSKQPRQSAGGRHPGTHLRRSCTADEREAERAGLPVIVLPASLQTCTTRRRLRRRRAAVPPRCGPAVADPAQPASASEIPLSSAPFSLASACAFDAPFARSTYANPGMATYLPIGSRCKCGQDQYCQGCLATSLNNFKLVDDESDSSLCHSLNITT